jgi:hypothetical protein
VVLAFLGLPGAGKTTLARAIADISGVAPLLEPEESEWPAFVRDPHPQGDFTRLCWFRSQRVPLYYIGAELREQGNSCVLDSYYDKWCIGWLGLPGLEWLISPDDPYFAVARSMAQVDADVLPRADAVVMLEIEEPLWRAQIAARGRGIDRHAPFANSYASQAHFVETALTRGAQDGTDVIRFTRSSAPPRDEAVRILALLEENGCELD